jgi:hypothetical protein
MAKFSIDCTLPPHNTTFVHSPDARGTLDIVYSCLAIIALCTWSVLHLNVPLQITSETRRQKLVRSVSRTLTKVKWMAFNIMAPEWSFAQAVCGLMNERQLQRKFDHYGKLDKVPWTRSHTQLANMGGFAIRFPPSCAHLDHAGDQSESTPCVVDELCYNRM